MSRKKFSETLNQLKEIVLEHEELRPLDHERYGTEHLLIALAELPNSQAAKILADEGFLPAAAIAELTAIKGKSNPNKPAPPGHASGASTSDLFRNANALAGQYNSSSVTAEHLLLAIVQRQKTGAYELLTKLNVSPQKIESALVKRLQESATKRS